MKTYMYPLWFFVFAGSPRRNLLEACSNDAECPQDSRCTIRGCDGSICLCRGNKIPNLNYTKCVSCEYVFIFHLSWGAFLIRFALKCFCWCLVRSFYVHLYYTMSLFSFKPISRKKLHIGTSIYLLNIP